MVSGWELSIFKTSWGGDMVPRMTTSHDIKIFKHKDNAEAYKQKLELQVLYGGDNVRVYGPKEWNFEDEQRP